MVIIGEWGLIMDGALIVGVDGVILTGEIVFGVINFGAIIHIGIRSKTD
jgi:hypothetical protein